MPARGLAPDAGAAARLTAAAPVAWFRLAVGGGALGVLGWAYGLRIAAGDASPIDFFGYFTNLTTLLAATLLLTTGALSLGGFTSPRALITARAVGVTCLLAVGAVYNVLVPGTGSAPPWVSAALHVVVPLIVLADWVCVGDRPALPWRMLWVVLPHPVVWLAIVLARGVADGWVPYGFLLPSRGAASLALHVAGLLAALLAAGALVWALSRGRGVLLRRGA
ncbi:Pr6Pr family membrane protein [Microbacterium gilvum]|uniref:Pr6Pr family membrane protein n=1 Tax=Microbacterium gilvum TaxID=1336204 RepID=UPI0031EB212D